MNKLLTRKRLGLIVLLTILLSIITFVALTSCNKDKEPPPPVPPIELVETLTDSTETIIYETNGLVISNKPIKAYESNRSWGLGYLIHYYNDAASNYLVNSTDITYLQFLVNEQVFKTLTPKKFGNNVVCGAWNMYVVNLYVYMQNDVSDPIEVRWRDNSDREIWGTFYLKAWKNECKTHFLSDFGIEI